jgi:hypothetical protein
MGKKPGHIVLPNGDRYDVVVMRILEKDAAGRPRKLLVIDEDETVQLDDGLPNEFAVVYGRRDMFKGDFT